MKKLGRTAFQVHNKHNRISYFVCCLMVFASLFLTACSMEDTSDNDAISNENTVSNITHNSQQRGWVYIPEVTMVEDEHADYERMQPVGDAFC